MVVTYLQDKRDVGTVVENFFIIGETKDFTSF